jgi:hypothetical protein
MRSQGEAEQELLHMSFIQPLINGDVRAESQAEVQLLPAAV